MVPSKYLDSRYYYRQTLIRIKTTPTNLQSPRHMVRASPQNLDSQLLLYVSQGMKSNAKINIGNQLLLKFPPKARDKVRASVKYNSHRHPMKVKYL